MRLLLASLLLFYSSFLVANTITVWGEIYPPFGYVEDGKPAGMSSEITTLLLKTANIEVDQWIMAPWGRVYLSGTHNPNTLIYTVGRTSDREDKFFWIGPIAPPGAYLYKLKSRIDIHPKSYDDLKKYVIGGLISGGMTERLIGEGFNVSPVAKNQQNIHRLIRERVDVIIMTSIQMKYYIDELGYDPNVFESVWSLTNKDSGQYHIAINKETDPKTLKMLQQAFDEISKNGQLKVIQNRYLVE
ncbi:transporter substrate-binding domain-containing protein [Vibrio profundum]|uniref:substrate-binding periplasmic protein n=1 Tax=Vibrio profundum TaxID=2910247 RepID=UPI003D0C03E2